MGYISKPMSTRQIIFCMAIILIGSIPVLYHVCTTTYTAKAKPCVITISIEDLCIEKGRDL